jgi:hypothetical protein
MSSVTMDMSGYKTERSCTPDEHYDDEVLYAGWNPSLALQQYAQTERNRLGAMPIEFAAVSVDLFMKKMYAYQR